MKADLVFRIFQFRAYGTCHIMMIPRVFCIRHNFILKEKPAFIMQVHLQNLVDSLTRKCKAEANYNN